MIKGYRKLTEEELTVINSIKSVENFVAEAVKSVAELDGIDQRFVSIAKTDLQKGFMALTRSVARPESNWD